MPGGWSVVLLKSNTNQAWDASMCGGSGFAGLFSSLTAIVFAVHVHVYQVHVHVSWRLRLGPALASIEMSFV